ncbi:MAG: PqqD family protein [Azoarcus sp.]|jgi:hypothetical protein|nr:PqqD family protein [Azoarcus sp.]
MQRSGISAVDVRFDGVPQAVSFEDCAPLLEMLPEVFPTWTFCQEERAPAAAPVIRVRRIGDEYRMDAPWLEKSIFANTAVSVFSSIVVDLIYAWLAAHPAALCLHSAAVAFNGRLVVFPNTNKVGKSLLVTRLMAENCLCFGDDLLALTPQLEGMSFGVPPRLRLPLPNSEKKVTDFVRAHGGRADCQTQYLASDAPQLAAFGETRPIGALVMLKRKTQGRADIVPADAADSLRNMVYQNLMRRGSALDVIERSQRLTAEKPCWILRYARLDDAVALLRSFFGDTDIGFARSKEEKRTDVETITPAPDSSRACPSRKRASNKKFIRRPGVLVKTVQEEHFLVEEAGDAIFHLNTLGRAVWELLAEPLSERDALECLSAVFPDVPRARIASDLIALFTTLKKGLLTAL